jgi:mono/diheme cytochrome c family protein
MRVFEYRGALLSACLPIAAAMAACNQPPAQPATPVTTAAAPAAQSPVERGKTLVTAGGCNDCHTTKKMGPNGPEPDMSKMLSGHPEDFKITAPYKPAKGSPWGIGVTDTLTAWSGPWGVSFAANLTPDQNTGLGGGVWSEEVFVKALKTGKHMGTSRDILPPMPWNWYSQLSEEDLKAIWAYLRTIPPVTNHVPDPIPPGGAPAAKK